MIECLKKIQDKKLKIHVLKQLHLKGIKSEREYIHYSYKELKQIAHFLREHYFSLNQNEITAFLDKFNSAETEWIRKFQNLSEDKLKALNPQETIKQENTRTRLAVSRILKGIEDTDNKKKDAQGAFERLKSIFT